MADNASIKSEKNSKNNENTGVVTADTPSAGGDVATSPQGQPGQERQPTGMESFFAVTKSLILRGIVIYFITSFFRRPAATPPTSNQVDGVPRLPATNIFDNGTKIDVLFYMSEYEEFNDFQTEGSLVWELKNIAYGDWYGGPNGDGTYSLAYNFTPSAKVRNNGTLYLHAYALRHGKSPDPTSPLFGRHEISYTMKQLNKFKRQKYQKTHNLLTGETALTPEQQKIAEKKLGTIVSHWHPNVTVNIVTDATNWAQGSVPAPLDEYIQFLPGAKHYKPPLYVNDYWNMKRDYQPINASVTSLLLHITYQPLSLFRWQLYFSQSQRNKWTNMDIFGDSANADEDDDDTLKEALLETSPYLLAITAVISVLHSVFELLAFKNDIQFWNNRKSLEGLSVRSVFFNVFQSLIVLLYVMDNDTNTIVRISCFLGLGIEVWKINKVVDVRIDRENPLFGVIPRIVLKDKGSYVESSTREYDTMAFKYLTWAIYPLLAGYGIYSLLYLEHKGWYSWVLNMLYGFLLTFGFIMMTPQLFINYKLKSVAHLPWRMMTYKALNTFIDDIFAFVIKMPTMYRLGCFRDDIVFFIFLYQKFIYKTDLTRVNEFGFSAEPESDTQAAITEGADGVSAERDKKND